MRSFPLYWLPSGTVSPLWISVYSRVNHSSGCLLAGAISVQSGAGCMSIGESAKLYGLAAPGSRLLKAFSTLGVVPPGGDRGGGV